MSKIDIKTIFRGIERESLPKTPKEKYVAEIPLTDPASGGSSKGASIKDESVISGLEEIQDKYQTSVKEKAKAYADRVVRGEFDSDDELYDKAEESLKGTYDAKRDALTREYESKVSDLNYDKDGYGADREKSKEKVKSAYQKAWYDNLDDLSRRGLSHSTIADLTSEEVKEGYRSAIRETDEAYDRKVQAIERKIQKADEAYNTALKNYEISYAIKLEDKLNRLKAERDRAVDKYEKEHQDDKQKAYDRYLINRSTQDKLYEDEYGDYLSEKKANYEERYNYLLSELQGKDKDEIASFIKRNEKTLRGSLGLYYDRFVEEGS